MAVSMLLKIAQGQVAFFELAVIETQPGQFADLGFEAAGGGFGEAAAGAFDDVAEHDDRGFLAARLGAGIAEFHVAGRRGRHPAADRPGAWLC